MQPSLLLKHLRDDNKVFARPEMLQMHSTVLMEQVAEHLNIVSIGVDGVPGWMTCSSKSVQLLGKAHRNESFCCQIIPCCTGQRQTADSSQNKALSVAWR